MLAAARTPRRDRIAIGISIGIHLCVLVLVALTFPRMSVSSDDPDERTLLSSVLHIEHRAPRAARTATAETAPQHPAIVPVVHPAVAREHAARQLVVAREQRAGAAPSAHTPPPRPHPTIAPVQIAHAPAPIAEATGTPQPVSTPSATTAPAQREEGIGNFSESYPATIDPALRVTLFAGISGVVVRIGVDENGRATSIDFVRSPADAAQREELRSRILATRFTPASCNGLRCAGVVELRS